MKVQAIQITLAELQEALLDYAAKKGVSQPEIVEVVSFSKSIRVDLVPGGTVETDAFRHRANVEQV